MNITLATKPIVIPELPGFSELSGSGTSGGDFAASLGAAINQVESTQQSARTAAMDLLAGGKGDIHTVALATQRAELSMELFQQVRNKFVQAYQEVMKMPM
jgi:flagellar hook-basal body complex protein FliE